MSRLFQPVRKQFKLPRKQRGKRDRQRQEAERFVVQVDGRKVFLAPEEYPGLLISFAFEFPTALLGIQPTLQSFTGYVELGQLPQYNDRLNRLRAKFGSHAKIVFPIYGKAEEVGRLLAKIAHAYAVAELGLEGFRPFLLGIIRGQDTYLLHHLVGSAVGPKEAVGGDLHEIEVLPSAALNSGNLVVVKIRLFANQGMTPHYVVAGERL